MEETSSISSKSRKKKARTLLKKCFKNPIFSLVPFEIWRDILYEPEGIVVCRVAQTCWGLKELVDNLRELLLEYALKCRREDKMEMAKNLLLRCSEIGSHRAMLDVAYAYWSGNEWGLGREQEIGVKLLGKLALCGNATAMAYYSDAQEDEKLRYFWGKKALSSNDAFAVGYCNFRGLGTEVNYDQAFERFQMSAKEGDEYGQEWLGMCVEYGYGVEFDYEKAFCWYLKSAEQGFASAQFSVARMLKKGKGCQKNDDLSEIWTKKARNQRLLPEK